MKNENIDIIQFFMNKHIILDAKIVSLIINSDRNKCNIQIVFQPIINDYKDKNVAVTFIDVKKIDLFDDEGAIVNRYVESYKLLRDDNEDLYFSFDPDESKFGKSNDDAGIIICKDITWHCND